jgi:hypothetical protein
MEEGGEAGHNADNVGRKRGWVAAPEQEDASVSDNDDTDAVMVNEQKVRKAPIFSILHRDRSRTGTTRCVWGDPLLFGTRVDLTGKWFQRRC